MLKRKIKVLIVDDSLITRNILSAELSKDPFIEIVGTATDPYDARDKIIDLQPDVMTLDIEMPKMNGLEFLKKLMPQHPLPVVVVSSLTEEGSKYAIEALERGAVDFVQKTDFNSNLNNMILELITKIKISSIANVSHWKKVNSSEKIIEKKLLKSNNKKIIVIGASTGGTEAIKKILINLPSNMPPIVIVQHMPPVFTKMFADNLNKKCNLQVDEAKSGDELVSGRVFIAPGGYHIKVVEHENKFKLICTKGDKYNGHCPSIDIFFESVAKTIGKNAYGVLLTGMGKDGAKGLKTMRDSGATNIVQDEESCVVFGMPKVAYDIGAAQYMVNLSEMSDFLIHEIEKSK
ncbi:MAG: chemotaxis response regulator protein-glutamate methylesterase [Candidatus Sericytochromatia bacterium]